MRIPLDTRRHWVVLVFGAIGVGLLPWAFWLSASLKPHHDTGHWDIAWSGFDVGLALCFCGTALAAWRRSPWVAAFAAATGTLLLADAWFDIILESRGSELRTAILEAVLVELPMAAVCYWIAYRMERFLERVLHLSSAGQRAPEGHLVGVLEVPADRKTAREAGHSNTSA